MARWAWLRRLVYEDETHFLALTRHFFHQFFENEFVARGGESRLTMVHVLALLAVPPILYTFFLIESYGSIAALFPEQYPVTSLIDHCRYVTLSMIVMGFVALLEWDALFLDRRDFAILTPLPVPPTTILAAKIAALLGFVALFIVDVAGVPALLFPLVETEGVRGGVSFFHLCNMLAAHAVAVFSGSAFVFLCLVAVQGLFINLFRPQTCKAVSRCFQLLTTVALLLALLLLPSTSNAVPVWVQAHGGGWFFWFPPLWFVGLYQTILGLDGALFHSLARTAAIASGIVTLVCCVGYVLNYQRHMQSALERVESSAPKPFILSAAARWALTHIVLRRPLERATYFFVTNTLLRSTKHRLYLTAYVGAGFALAAFGTLGALAYTTDQSLKAALSQPSVPLLAIPLIVSLFLLAGMRVVFAIPAELQANWIFQTAEDEGRIDYLAGVRKVMAVRVVLLLASLFPIYAYLWEWVPAFQQLIFSLVLSLILIELLLVNFRKIPFTCSYQPGKANMSLLGALYWFAFTTYGYTMAALERWLMHSDTRWLVSFVLFFALLAVLKLRRKATSVSGVGITFEDLPNPEVQTLGLGG